MAASARSASPKRAESPTRLLVVTSISSDSRSFIARILERGASAFAFDAASALAARREDLARAFGESAVESWRELIANHVKELARAVEDRRPQEFARQIGWARIAYAARSFPRDFLLEALLELRRVLERELPENARSGALSVLDLGIATLREAAPTESGTRVLHPLTRDYVRRLLEGDRRAASRGLVDAVRSGAISLSDAYVEVCLGAQREIGCLWHRNEISIAVEHFVTAAAQCTMSELFALAPESPRNGKTALAATVAGDRHDIGLRCTSDLLAIDGWKAIHLGSDVPVEDIVAGAGEFEVDLVVLSGTLPAHRRGVSETVAALKAIDPAPRILIGGSAFDGDEAMWRATGADGYASSPVRAVELAREMRNG